MNQSAAQSPVGDMTEARRDTHDIQTYRVRSYECGPDGRIFFWHICNYLQETASIHADKLGFSKKNFEPLGLAWVITRLRVRLDDCPAWGEDVVVLTYPRSMRKLTAGRDFVMSRSDGTPLGVATSEWMVMNMETRRAGRIPEIVASCTNNVRPPVWDGEPFERLEFPETADVVELKFAVQHSHIDLNQHVNNTHYLEWMMECTPEAESGSRVADIEVIYRGEARHGDVVVARCAPCRDGERMHQVATEDGRVLITARTKWVGA
ncbi:MAG: acyl-[acyl-carrier-protein] thioesterase [Kiritimatiellia bacterium]|jgi:medium-chain acyl-[acyl-carrier-protein] hydrolase